MLLDDSFLNKVKVRIPLTEYKGPITNGLERIKDLRSVRVFKEYKNQPTISQKTDGGNIGKDGLLVESIPGHPLLFVHRTILQVPNESAVVEFGDSVKDDLSDHDKPSLMVKCNKNLSFMMGLVSRRVRRDSPITGWDIGSRGRH